MHRFLAQSGIESQLDRAFLLYTNARVWEQEWSAKTHRPLSELLGGLQFQDKRGWRIDFKQPNGYSSYQATYYLVIIKTCSDLRSSVDLRDSLWTVQRIRDDPKLTDTLREMLVLESRLRVEPTIIDYETASLSRHSSSATLCDSPQGSFSPTAKFASSGSLSYTKPHTTFQGRYGVNSIQVIEGKAEVDMHTIALLVTAAEKDQKFLAEEAQKQSGLAYHRPMQLRRAEYVQVPHRPFTKFMKVTIWMGLAVVVVALAHLARLKDLVVHTLEFEGLL